jgi:hypothetical protein
MQIRRSTRFGKPKNQKVLADDSAGIMVCSDPLAVGGLWLTIPGQGTENGKLFHIRLEPVEIEALWAAYQEKGAGKARTKDWQRVLADLLDRLAHEEGSWYTDDEEEMKLLDEAYDAYYGD